MADPVAGGVEQCVVVCRSQKPPERQGKVLFIDAVNEVAHERAMSTLRPEYQQKIEAAYVAFTDEVGFVKAATREEIAAQDYSLSIPMYLKRLQANGSRGDERNLRELWATWEQEGHAFWQEMDELIVVLDDLEK